MRLIIREYLASLKERDELDAILPDLLSELGLTVYSRPGRGTRQDGVDVAAVGSMDGGEDKVYLLSIKSGDLTRGTWDGATLQSLRPSLNEILDAYIANRLPVEHEGKPIVICLCFGGDIQEQVRPQVEAFIEKNTGDGISFEEWNGDRLAELVLTGFLREDLIPENYRSMLRKSLALLDEPDISYRHFGHLVHVLASTETKDDKDKLRIIRQLNISLWILYSWCRDANNLESAYRSAELTLLNVWELCKPFLDKNTKVGVAARNTLDAVHFVYQSVTEEYLSKKILPHSDKRHALSHAVYPSTEVDVNLKLFEVFSRVAIRGIWAYWERSRIPPVNQAMFQEKNDEIDMYSNTLKDLITNNPILFSPYKDDQGIDIFIVLFFLSLDVRNKKDIHTWLSELMHRVHINYKTHGRYPCNLHSYHELIEHPRERNDAYQKEVTAGSILYPVISLFSALLGFDDIYKNIQDFKRESLEHCNLQLWYPDDVSEEFFYTNKEPHGAILSDVFVDKSRKEFLDQVFGECEHSKSFEELSAVKYQVWPMIFLACRHYRLPLPVHFLQWMRPEKLI